MSGTNQSVKVTLRNPLDHSDQLTYTITVFDNAIAQDWYTALKEILVSGNLLEKNYCFLGFPETARDLSYLCKELNAQIQTINEFNAQDIWKSHGLESYTIEEWFCPDVIRYGSEYSVKEGGGHRDLGLKIKHSVMNRLHNHFEKLQGTVSNLSPYYKTADYATKYAIRQLNNLCHEIENLILSQRKLVTQPEWVRSAQITTFLQCNRYNLKDQHRQLFVKNGYDRVFGGVYMHWTQIGKTLFEVWRDEHAPKLDTTTCEAITHLQYYSGEFDVEWGNDVTDGGQHPWHSKELQEFKQWLLDNRLDPQDPKLSLGYLPVGKIDTSVLGNDPIAIRSKLSRYLDIYKIEIEDTVGIFDYCWTDIDYKQTQIGRMKPGYDFSSRG